MGSIEGGKPRSLGHGAFLKTRRSLVSVLGGEVDSVVLVVVGLVGVAVLLALVVAVPRLQAVARAQVDGNDLVVGVAVLLVLVVHRPQVVCTQGDTSDQEDSEKSQRESDVVIAGQGQGDGEQKNRHASEEGQHIGRERLVVHQFSQEGTSGESV